MSNVHPFKPQQALQAIERARSNSDNPPQEPSFGGGGGGSNMETRIAKLEAVAEKTGERLAQIDVRLARMDAKLDSHEKLFASKEDVARVEGSLKTAVAEAKTSIILWVVSAFVLSQLLPTLLSQLSK